MGEPLRRLLSAASGNEREVVFVSSRSVTLWRIVRADGAAPDSCSRLRCLCRPVASWQARLFVSGQASYGGELRLTRLQLLTRGLLAMLPFAGDTAHHGLQLQFQYARRPRRLLSDPLESYTTACLTRRGNGSPRLLLVASDRVSLAIMIVAPNWPP